MAGRAVHDGESEEEGKRQTLLHTHEACESSTKTSQRSHLVWARDAPQRVSLYTSVSHRELAAMDVNKERKES